MGRRPYSMKIDQTPLLNTLIEATRSSGLTVDDLSKKSGINRAHLYDVLNGWSAGSMGLWQRVLDAGEIEIGWRHKEERRADDDNVSAS